MFETLLVPLDGSLFGEQALATAALIAERTGATLELLRVHAPSELRELTGANWNDVLRHEARIYLLHAAEHMEHRLGVPIPTTLLEGDAAESLCDHFARHGTALVVMATHGRTGVSRAWLGSVADGVVRRSSLPVLLVRVDETRAGLTQARAKDAPYRRILVPLDGSNLSEAIVKHAMELGRVMGAHLHLLTVVEPLYSVAFGAPVPVAVPIDEGEARARARHYIQDLVDALRPQYAPYEITGELRENELAAPAILERAKFMNADVIALATHGRGVSRLVVGSVADKVLRGSVADVLTIRPMHD